jgi:hypothetical protein
LPWPQGAEILAVAVDEAEVVEIPAVAADAAGGIPVAEVVAVETLAVAVDLTRVAVEECMHRLPAEIIRLLAAARFPESIIHQHSLAQTWGANPVAEVRGLGLFGPMWESRCPALAMPASLALLSW